MTGKRCAIIGHHYDPHRCKTMGGVIVIYCTRCPKRTTIQSRPGRVIMSEGGQRT